MDIKRLSDDELLLLLRGVAGVERDFMGKALAYLGEVDARALYRDKSCPSMFAFCVRHLKMSEDQACRRINVARLARRFPPILAAIVVADLHLTSAERIGPFVTDENVHALIEQAKGKSRAEVDLLIARLAPKPDVPEAISIVPEQKRLVVLANSVVALPAPAVPSAQVKPLSETSYCISLTIPAPVHDVLQDVRRMMRHQNAGGELAMIFERALRLLHAELERQVRGATTRPRRSRGSADPGYVTRATRREVHERDGGRCTFVGADGERCPARDFLELDHAQPRALGGSGDAANIRLRCRTHNRHAAEQVFGREHVEARVRAQQAKSRGKKARLADVASSTPQADAAESEAPQSAAPQSAAPQSAAPQSEAAQSEAAQIETSKPDALPAAAQEPVALELEFPVPLGALKRTVAEPSARPSVLEYSAIEHFAVAHSAVDELERGALDAPLAVSPDDCLATAGTRARKHVRGPRAHTRVSADTTDVQPASAQHLTCDRVRFALVRDLRFDGKLTDGVLARMPTGTWERPVPEIIHEAIGLVHALSRAR